MTDRDRPSLPRNLTAWLAAVVLGLAGVALAGCGGDDGASAEAPAKSAEAADAGDIEFEPAYPDEVSPEGLTAEDVRQQETPHRHGGEAHAHEDEGEDHAHDEGGAHAHDEDHVHDGGEDQHDHDEDGHAH